MKLKLFLINTNCTVFSSVSSLLTHSNSHFADSLCRGVVDVWVQAVAIISRRIHIRVKSLPWCVCIKHDNDNVESFEQDTLRYCAGHWPSEAKLIGFEVLTERLPHHACAPPKKFLILGFISNPIITSPRGRNDRHSKRTRTYYRPTTFEMEVLNSIRILLVGNGNQPMSLLLHCEHGPIRHFLAPALDKTHTDMLCRWQRTCACLETQPIASCRVSLLFLLWFRVVARVTMSQNNLEPKMSLFILEHWSCFQSSLYSLLTSVSGRLSLSQEMEELLLARRRETTPKSAPTISQDS